MSNGLTFERPRDMPLGMRIQAAMKILRRKPDVRMLVIADLDVDCRYCKHTAFNPPCVEEVPMALCDNCEWVCPCRGCNNNSRYEYCGDDEALRRMEQKNGE